MNQSDLPFEKRVLPCLAAWGVIDQSDLEMSFDSRRYQTLSSNIEFLYANVHLQTKKTFWVEDGVLI